MFFFQVPLFKLFVEAPQVMFKEKNTATSVFGCQSIDELIDVVEDAGNSYFKNYWEETKAKKRQFRAGCFAAGVDLNGLSVLDIGPGTGDSLEVAREQGARVTMAVDMNPYFTKLQLLRGHQAFLRNYTRKDALNRYYPVECSGVDFIWSKGALNCYEYANGSSPMRWIKDKIKGFDLAEWFTQMQGLTSKKGCIVFTPAVSRQSTFIEDPDYPIKTLYWVPDKASFRQSKYISMMESLGFSVIEGVKDLNHDQAFPFSFVWKR
jgi:SAM-dependent methyltransferase